MGERTLTTTMGTPRRSPMKHLWSMGEQSAQTIDRVLAKKVNQHG